MEFHATTWMEELTRRLLERFGERLLFTGLQGSRQRGEARADSDIDVVVILDQIDGEDLSSYREILRGMPWGELCCGFVCGREELRAWPGYDLVALSRDTGSYYGDLHALLPKLGRKDEAECVQIGAANLYHAACHTLLFGPLEPDVLRELDKSAFFVLRMNHLLQTGEYLPTRRELLSCLAGEERQLLTDSLEDGGSLTPQERLDRLIVLSGKILRRKG